MNASTPSLNSSFAYRTYRAATGISGPLLRQVLKRRLARGKEDGERVSEKMGYASLTRPAGRLIWFHAASVGESVSLLPLLKSLLAAFPDLHVLFTTGTLTSARLMGERLPDRAFHQFVPLDHPAYCARFLDHWRPDVGVIVESELWPNLIATAQAHGTRLALINARLSEKSFSNWQKAGRFAKALLASFELILAQDDRSAERLSSLSSQDVQCLGHLKYDAPALPVDGEALEGLRSRIGVRPVWTAASTHAGEEEIVADVHQRLSPGHKNLLTVLVPRHPERGDAVAILLRELGLNVAQRSAGEALSETTDIYLADTLGETGLFFSLAPLAFVGGSFVPIGGHNPFEPIRLGAIAVTGPLMANFETSIRDLVAAKAALQVQTSEALADSIGAFLAAPDQQVAYRQAGEAFVKSVEGVTDRVLSCLTPLIDAPKHEGPSNA